MFKSLLNIFFAIKIIIIWLRFHSSFVCFVLHHFLLTAICVEHLSPQRLRLGLLVLCYFSVCCVFTINWLLILSRKSVCISVAKFIMINLIIQGWRIERWYHTDLFLRESSLLALRTDIQSLSSQWCLYLVVGHVGLVLFHLHAVSWVAFEYLHQYDLSLIRLR